MYVKFFFNKLIRSKLLEKMKKERDVELSFHSLDMADYREKLAEKLLEEAKEAAHSLQNFNEIKQKGQDTSLAKQDLIVEFADLLEVMLTISDNIAIDFDEIEEARIKKKEIKGIFSSKNYVKEIKVSIKNKKLIDYLSSKYSPHFTE